MIYLIIGLIVFTIIEVYIIKDIVSIFKVNGIITIISGYLTIIFNYILNTKINNEINFINISKATNIILKRTISKGLVLVLIGTIEYIIYIIIYINKRRTINK